MFIRDLGVAPLLEEDPEYVGCITLAGLEPTGEQRLHMIHICISIPESFYMYTKIGADQGSHRFGPQSPIASHCPQSLRTAPNVPRSASHCPQ